MGSPVGLGYLRDPAGGVVSRDFVSAGRYQVNVGGELYPATVTLRPPFDPDNTRVRCPLTPASPRRGPPAADVEAGAPPGRHRE